MKAIKLFFWLLLAVVLMQSQLLKAQDAEPAQAIVDWSNPETINPGQPGIDDFLDGNRFELLKKAFEAYQKGDYDLSAKYYLALLRLDITDYTSIYNLACCYSLMGSVEPAAKNLLRSVKAGFRDLNHIRQDPDFDKVRDSEPFRAAMDSVALWLGEKGESPSKLIYIKSPMLLKCRLVLPEGYEPKKKYPLVIGLHGRGGNADDFSRLWEKLDKPVDFIYAAPQAPFVIPGGDRPRYSWGPEDVSSAEAREPMMQAAEDYIIETVQTLKAQFPVSKVYLLGFSQGAYLTYIIGIKNYKLFEGLIPYGGGFVETEIPEKSLESGRKLRIFIGHGTKDQVVKPEESENSRKILVDHGYQVIFYQFEGEHTVPPEMLEATLEWMNK